MARLAAHAELMADYAAAYEAAQYARSGSTVGTARRQKHHPYAHTNGGDEVHAGASTALAHSLAPTCLACTLPLHIPQPNLSAPHYQRPAAYAITHVRAAHGCHGCLTCAPVSPHTVTCFLCLASLAGPAPRVRAAHGCHGRRRAATYKPPQAGGGQQEGGRRRGAAAQHADAAWGRRRRLHPGGQQPGGGEARHGGRSAETGAGGGWVGGGLGRTGLEEGCWNGAYCYGGLVGQVCG